MQKIWKYPLSITNSQILMLPTGAKILCVKTQFGNPKLWVLVDDTRLQEPRHIKVIGTGDNIDPLVSPARYIDTFMAAGDTLVFHVFEADDV